MSTDFDRTQTVYAQALSGLHKNPQFGWVKDASILIDMLWQHYLRDLVQETGLNHDQAHDILRRIVETFVREYDGESDPRRLLNHLMRSMQPEVRKMEPLALSEEVGELDAVQEQIFRDVMGELFQ